MAAVRNPETSNGTEPERGVARPALYLDLHAPDGQRPNDFLLSDD
jgi:hypothetical protein